MAEINLEQLAAVATLLVGVSMIVFRKCFVRDWWAGGLRKAKPEDRRRLQQTKYKHILLKVEEGALVVGGLIFIVLSIWKLFG